jgi:hypothetical protein
MSRVCLGERYFSVRLLFRHTRGGWLKDVSTLPTSLRRKGMTREDALAELARRADEQAALALRAREFHNLQDSYYINYEIGDTQLIIRFYTFELMTIPYSEIVEIEVASSFDTPPARIYLGNGTRKMCRIKKSRGWFRYVTITPREPQILLDAFHAFRLRADPITEMSENARLPTFLRPHDDPQ